MKRVLFLDVDGVLNHAAWLKANGRQNGNLSTEEWRLARHRAHLDPDCVARLESVIKRTGCALVLSSSWRYDVTPEEMTARLRERGAPSANVIDSTLLGSQMPSGLYAGTQRGNEVDEWLTRNGADSFAIVDDDAELEPHMARLVQTSWEIGLQDEHVERLVALLGEARP